MRRITVAALVGVLALVPSIALSASVSAEPLSGATESKAGAIQNYGTASEIAQDLIAQAAAILTQGYNDANLLDCDLSGPTSVSQFQIMNSSAVPQQVTWNMDKGTAQETYIATSSVQVTSCGALNSVGNPTGQVVIPPRSTGVLYVVGGGNALGCGSAENPGCNLNFTLSGTSGTVTLNENLNSDNGFYSWATQNAIANGFIQSNCLYHYNGTGPYPTGVSNTPVQDGNQEGLNNALCFNIAENAANTNWSGTLPTKYEFPSVFTGNYGAGNVIPIDMVDSPVSATMCLMNPDGSNNPAQPGSDSNEESVTGVQAQGLVYSDASNTFVQLGNNTLQLKNTIAGESVGGFSIALLNPSGQELRWVSSNSSWVLESQVSSAVWAKAAPFSTGGSIVNVTFPQQFTPSGALPPAQGLFNGALNGYWGNPAIPNSDYASAGVSAGMGPPAAHAPYDFTYAGPDGQLMYFTQFPNSMLAQISTTGTPGAGGWIAPPTINGTSHWGFGPDFGYNTTANPGVWPNNCANPTQAPRGINALGGTTAASPLISYDAASDYTVDYAAYTPWSIPYHQD